MIIPQIASIKKVYQRLIKAIALRISTDTSLVIASRPKGRRGNLSTAGGLSPGEGTLSLKPRRDDEIASVAFAPSQ
jgi:hypothetical protein